MANPQLLFRERQGLATIITLTLQCVLDRTPGDFDPEPVLREIEDVVSETIAAIRGRSSRPTCSESAIETPKVVAEPRRIKALSPSPRIPHTAFLSSPQEKLPDELLQRVLHYLPRRPDLCPGFFTDLISASHVCRRWRSVALSSPALWSVIHTPSFGEMGAFGALLSRSGSRPLYLELNLAKVYASIRQEVFVSLARHVHQIVRLVLRYDSDYEAEHERQLLSSRAPVLQELRLYSNKRVQLRDNFLGGKAPALTTLALAPLSLLPPSCPALASITTLHLLNHPQPLSVDDARYVFRLCPKLTRVRMDACLRGAAATVAIKTVDEFRGLRMLNVSELGADGLCVIMVTTLRMFAYKDIAHVHLRSATTATIAFAMKELKGLKHVFFLRAPAQAESVLLLRDKEDRQHSMSLLAEAALEGALKKVWMSAWQLTSLGIWEFLFPRDSVALAELDLKSVTILTIFVRGRSLRARIAGASLLHVFDVFQKTKKEWRLPALATLAFDARAPLEDVFPDPPPGRPTLSAAALLHFYHNMIQRGVARPPCLVLDSVALQERFAGPEVAALRRAFADVLMYV